LSFFGDNICPFLFEENVTFETAHLPGKRKIQVYKAGYKLHVSESSLETSH